MPWKSDNFDGGGFARPTEAGPVSITNNRKGAILIADDSSDDAHHAATIVGKLHSSPTVRVVSGGEDVLAYLEGRGEYENRATNPYPVLLLLDLLMPGTDGFAVLKWLQAHPEHHALPVIVLSVVREFRQISHAYQLGARSFLMKPLVLDEFRMALHAMSILPDSDLYAESELPPAGRVPKTAPTAPPERRAKAKRPKQPSAKR